MSEDRLWCSSPIALLGVFWLQSILSCTELFELNNLLETKLASVRLVSGGGKQVQIICSLDQ